MFLSHDNPVYNTIIIFTIIILILYITKPITIYDYDKKEFRQFGTTKGKTLMPIYILAIIIAIVLYIVFYYISTVFVDPSKIKKNNVNITNHNNDMNNNSIHQIQQQQQQINNLQNQLQQILQQQLNQQLIQNIMSTNSNQNPTYSQSLNPNQNALPNKFNV